MSVATQEKKDLEYYMGLPYEVVIKPSEGGYFARVPDLPGCMTFAETYAELKDMIEDAKRGWIEVSLEHGDPIPEPRNLEDYSGKVNLRMPKTLHRDLHRQAEAERVSLNQLMVTVLARSVGALADSPADMLTVHDAAGKILGSTRVRIDRSVIVEDPASTEEVAAQAQRAAERIAEQAQQAAEQIVDQATEQAERESR
jgi:antitoxin HicB